MIQFIFNVHFRSILFCRKSYQARVNVDDDNNNNNNNNNDNNNNSIHSSFITCVADSNCIFL